jgi:hypothetical protein
MIKYRFRVLSIVVFTLYSYSKALEYPLEYCGSLIWEPTLPRSVSAKITCMQILHRPCKTDQICASCATASAWPMLGRIAHVRSTAPGHPAPDACPGLLCCFYAWASMPAWAPPDATSKRPIGQPHRWFLRGGQVLPARAHLACCPCLSEYVHAAAARH